MKISKHNFFQLSGEAFSVVLVTTIGFAFMFVVFPLFSDDFMFMEPMLDYFDRGKSPWPGFLNSLEIHYYTDNLRLSNIVFSLFLLLPKWVGCTLSGVGIFLTLRMMLLTACGEDRPVSIWPAIWMCLLFTFGLPWHDQIVIMCFQFNYVWPSVLALLCLRVFMGDTRCCTLPAVFLGFVTGWWHEGFSVPMIAGFVVLMLIWHKRYVSRKNLLMTAALIAGTLVIVLVPSFRERLSITNPGGNLLYLLVSTLRYFMPGILFVVIATLMLLSRRTRPVVLSPLCTFILVCLAVNYIIHVRTHFAARIGWWANLCAIMGIVYLGYQYLKIRPLSKKTGVVMKVVSVAAAVLLTAHLVCADVMTVKIRKETDNIIARYIAAPDVPEQDVFADFTDQLSAPMLAFQKPYYNLFTYNWQYIHTKRRYGKKNTLTVIPPQLEYVDGTQGELLPGGVRRVTNSIYYAPIDSKEEYCGGNGKIMVHGRYIPSSFYCSPFISKADGKRYLYIFPANMAFRTFGAPIEDVVLENLSIFNY